MRGRPRSPWPSFEFSFARSQNSPHSLQFTVHNPSHLKAIWPRKARESASQICLSATKHLSEADGVVHHPEMFLIGSVYYKEGGSPQELIPC